jgi:hypothetical protein
MRQLVVCCDGTWQTITKQTNVGRLHSAVVTPAGHPVPHYVKGAGATGNPVDALRGGLTGADLECGSPATTATSAAATARRSSATTRSTG